MATPSIRPETQPACAATNRANAQHSTGPRTVEGKQRVRLNALKHGLYSQTLLISDSDKAAYDRDAAVLEARYRPANELEREMVRTVHEYRWRFSCAITSEQNLRRLTEEQQLESIDQLFGEQDEENRRALAQAAGLQANARLFDQLSRHLSRLDRVIDRTLRELIFLISRRLEEMQRGKMTEQSQPDRAEPPRIQAQMPNFTGSLKEFKRKQWIRQQEKLNGSRHAA